MSKRSTAYLKQNFAKGKKPTGDDFSDLVDTLLEVPFFDIDPLATGPGIVPKFLVNTYQELLDGIFANIDYTDAELAAFGPAEFMALPADVDGMPYIVRAIEQANKLYYFNNQGSAEWLPWYPETYTWAKAVTPGRYFRYAADHTWEDMGTRNWALPPYVAGSNMELRLRIKPVMRKELPLIVEKIIPQAVFDDPTSGDTYSWFNAVGQEAIDLGLSNGFAHEWVGQIAGKPELYRFCPSWGAQFVLWTPNNEIVSGDAFVVLPTDLTKPQHVEYAMNIGLDTRYFVDTSENTGLTHILCENWTRSEGKRYFPEYGLGDINENGLLGYRFSNCNHFAAECYPYTYDGILDSIRWTPAGDLGLLYNRSNDNADGWGMIGGASLTPNAVGGVKHYILNTEQAQYLIDLMTAQPIPMSFTEGANTVEDSGEFGLQIVNGVAIAKLTWQDITTACLSLVGSDTGFYAMQWYDENTYSWETLTTNLQLQHDIGGFYMTDGLFMYDELNDVQMVGLNLMAVGGSDCYGLRITFNQPTMLKVQTNNLAAYSDNFWMTQGVNQILPALRNGIALPVQTYLSKDGSIFTSAVLGTLAEPTLRITKIEILKP